FSAMDRSGFKITKTMKVNVNDVSEAPLDIFIGNSKNTTLQIFENEIGALIGELHVIAESKNTDYSIIITDDPSGLFEIKDMVLSLKESSSLDYEDNGYYAINLKAIDNSNDDLYISKTFTIEVTDVNEQPTELILTNTIVKSSGKSGETVGRFYAIDPDNTYQTTQKFEYKLQDGDSYFQIVGETLTIKQSNFTDMDNVDITVTVTDDGFPPLSRDFRILLTIKHDIELPFNFELLGNYIDENSHLGTTVGRLGIVGSKHYNSMTNVHYMVQGNVPFRVQNDKVVVDGILDYELVKMYDIEIMAVNKLDTSLKLSKHFKVTINDVNEKPTIISITSPDNRKDVIIDDDMEDGAVVGQIASEDSEDGTLEVNIVNGSLSRILYVGATDCMSLLNKTKRTRCTSQIFIQRMYILPKSTTMDLEVEVQDQGGETSRGSIQCQLQHINHPPTDIVLGNAVLKGIQENTNEIGIKITTIDADPMDHHNYTISGDTFQIDGGIMRLNPGVILDYETIQEITINITSRDDGFPNMSLA
ncbi:unnamed protein product, partial [Owenia fusiformis]